MKLCHAIFGRKFTTRSRDTTTYKYAERIFFLEVHYAQILILDYDAVQMWDAKNYVGSGVKFTYLPRIFSGTVLWRKVCIDTIPSRIW